MLLLLWWSELQKEISVVGFHGACSSPLVATCNFTEVTCGATKAVLQRRSCFKKEHCCSMGGISVTFAHFYTSMGVLEYLFFVAQ